MDHRSCVYFQGSNVPYEVACAKHLLLGFCLGQPQAGATDDSLGIVSKNLLGKSMSNIPGKTNHPPTDKRRFSATNLSVILVIFDAGNAHDIPEKKVELDADINGEAFKDLKRGLVT